MQMLEGGGSAAVVYRLCGREAVDVPALAALHQERRERKLLKDIGCCGMG